MTQSPLASNPPNYKRWAAFIGIMLVLIAALLWNDASLDTTLWRATRWALGDQDRYSFAAQQLADAGKPDLPWYRTTPPPFHGTLFHKIERLVWVVRDFGEYYMTLILAAALALLHRHKCKAALLLLATTAFTAGLGALLAAVAGRLRPNGKALDFMLTDPRFTFLSGPPGDIRNDGYNVWVFLRGLHGSGDLSFPSGHATLAFATAAALAYLLPRGGVLFYIVAAGCALTRVILQAHFYSDILMGATLGIVLGALIARAAGRVLRLPASAPHAPSPA